MNQLPSKSAVSRQVELIIRKINSLSTLPGVLAAVLPLLKGDAVPKAELVEIIESDPALTARIFSLANQHSIQCPSVAEAVDKLAPSLVRDAVMSTRMFQAINPSTAEQVKSSRKELLRFALTVACAAREIGQMVLEPAQLNLAFSAGLLHNIGKLALDDAMPKSCEKILSEAQMLGQSDINIERKYLGIDHTIIGRRLADKWKLPEETGLAVWLHRSDAEVIKNSTPSSSLALVVRLAYLIARTCSIADSGSYEPAESPDSLADTLSISSQQIDDIRKKLESQVSGKSRLLGLDTDTSDQAYYLAVSELASQLAQDNTELKEQNKQLAASSGHLSFANEFLAGISPNALPIDIASDFAVRWQKFYNTGPVCIYLTKSEQNDFIDTTAIDGNGSIDITLLNHPDDSIIVPKEIQNKFDVVEPGDNLQWIFSQIDTSFDMAKTKAAPIIASGKTVAVILWQYNYLPQDVELLGKISAVLSLAGPVIALSYAHQGQQKLAEEFASLLGRMGNIKDKLSQTENLQELAEMAAGAAHELNNPIAVVSGRIQMLLDAEKGAKKKQSLNQILEKTEEISKIVSELMLFAKPPTPSPRTISPVVLVDSAVDFVRQELAINDVDVKIENIDNLRDVYIDSEQVAKALGQLIANAYESYHDTGGLVRITGAEQNDNFVRIQIIDEGSGMDSETLQKAKQPFFSDKAAGRKRGMGLSYAQRILQVNAASLHLTSKPGKGTTATIMLPCQ